MGRLNSPNIRYFNREDFEKYQLWVWDDENEGHLPISDSKYTGEYGTLFIKAHFECDNHSFDGYLVGFDVFYAFSLFINEKTVKFNVNITSFIEKSIQEIFEELNCKPFRVFPLKYTSPITYEDGKLIGGRFVLENGELKCLPNKG